MKNNKIAVLRIKSAIIFVCLMIIHTMGAALLVLPGTENLLPPSVWLNGQPIAGMTVNEAIVQLEASTPEEITIRFVDDQGQELEEVLLPVEFIEMQYPIAVIRKDLNKLVETDWQKKWIDAIRGTRDELNLEYALEYEEERLVAWAEQQKKRIDRDKVNAAVWVEGGVVKNTEEQVGRSLEVSLLMETIKGQIKKGPLETIKVVLTTHPPEVTLSKLGDYGRELVRFSTQLQDDDNRKTNIRLAGERINSTRILPGELFSFNDTVGDVLPEEGFQPAPVIANGRVVLGIGGGVCQVSSTLYQTALRAGFTIVERWHHSVPIGYLPLGMDAAVASGTKDLVFENPYAAPVMIGTWVEGEEYITALFGAKDLQIPRVSVEIRQHRVLLPSTTIVEDDMLDMGAKVVERAGKKGHWLQVYRIMEDEDGHRMEELISEDHYPPVDEIVRLGSGKLTKDKK